MQKSSKVWCDWAVAKKKKKKKKKFCNHKNVVNLIILYELGRWSRDLSRDFTQGDYLFGAVKLTDNVDLDKCGYSSGYGTGFDARSFVFLTK